MRKYELTLLARSDIEGEAKDKLFESIEKTVKAVGGKVGKVSEMGRKQLAFRIQNMNEANYFSWILELPGEGVIQLDKKLTVESQKKDILRHLLVQTGN